MSKLVITTFLALPVLICAPAFASAQAPPSDSETMTTSPSQSIAPDNTKSNREDPSNQANSADRQKDDKSDVQLTKRVRQSVMADKNLSTYAHNVKIVSMNGTVTLNGVVRSAQEKSEIVAKSAAIAGGEHVVDELKIAAAK
jgi:hyperosmotically inducible protein